VLKTGSRKEYRNDGNNFGNRCSVNRSVPLASEAPRKKSSILERYGGAIWSVRHPVHFRLEGEEMN
jgi:hypothetical protein